MGRPSTKLDLEAEEGDADALAENLFVGTAKDKSSKKANKKKRERREEEQEEEQVESEERADDDEEEAERSSPKAKKAKSNTAAPPKKKQKQETNDADDKYQRLILFVGQIPFEATAQDVMKHFEDHGAGKVQVRLLTEKGTNKSRGMAFVDFETPQQLVRGLRVHKTRLMGRAINVERTVGGGGNNEARKEKLKQLREYQGSRVRKEVEQLVTEALQRSGGMLTREVVDDLVVRSLCALPRDAVKQVLDEILESDIANARNKKAWILGCIKRYVSRLKTGEQFLTLEEEKAGIIEKRKEKSPARRGGRGGGHAPASSSSRSRPTHASSSSSRGPTHERGGSSSNKFRRGGIGSA